MAASKSFSPNLRSAFSIVIMIAVWLAFAPTQVGGMASYIIVIGKSMEPDFHIGDLVIVHKQPAYQVEDAVVYRNRQLESFVFHRIIAQELGHYTLQGDNNSWVDDYQPSSAEIVGKLWLHVPRGGIAVQKLRSPFAMAFIAGMLGVALISRLPRQKAKGSKPMNTQTVQEWFMAAKQKTQNWFAQLNSSRGAAPFRQREILEGSFFGLGVFLLSALILGMIVFSRPVSRTVQDDLSYQQLGVFGYVASAPQEVYDASSLKSGDPIFTKLTCSVDVNFQYTLIAAQAENITGTYQLTAILSEPVSGWQRVMPLQEEATFSGSSFGTNARLDLCKLSSLAQSMERETDFHPGIYKLIVTPNIRLAGKVANRTFESTFESGLVFHYDHVQFSLFQQEQLDPLAPTETEVLREERIEANTLLLFGREISIPALRWVAIIGLIVSLSGLTLLELRMQSLARLAQEKYFQIKYDALMVDVANANWLRPAGTIDIGSMEDLAKLAERSNAMIMHVCENDSHTYYVQAGGTTYRFRPNAVETPLAALREQAFNQEEKI